MVERAHSGWVAGLLAGLAAACGGPVGEAPDGGGGSAPVPEGALFDPTRWAEASAAEDPFEDRPAAVDCGPGGFGLEAGVLEVETEICGYLTAAQPLPADLPAGAVVTSVVWHLQLVSDPPATGHVALQIGEHRLFEAHPAIPGPEMVYPVEWTVPEDLPAGTPAYFHVHNHGYNSWRLGPVEAKPGP